MIHRPDVVGLLSALVLSCTLAAQPAPPVEPVVPYVQDGSDREVLAPDTPGSAQDLEAAASCHESMPRAALVALRWSPASLGAGITQRVDISKLRDGFATERFSMTRVLPDGTSGVSLEAPEPGINYYWRVLTATPDGWVSSKVERFEVPICPFDQVDESNSPQTPPSAGADDGGKE